VRDDVSRRDRSQDGGLRTIGEGGVSRLENHPPPWGKGEAGGVSFGTWLRRQREMRGIDLGTIAERTKISRRYLEAMEEDRFDVLPAPVFAKGFLREYARHVGLSPDEVVNHFLAAHEPPVEPEPLPARETSAAARSWMQVLLLALAGLLLLGLVAALAYWAERRRERTVAAESPPMAAPLGPATTAPPPPAERPGAPLELTLDFVEDCWVDLVIDGDRRIAELRVQGESLQVQAQETIHLKLGNGRGVQAQLNGRPVRLWPAEAIVVPEVAIDLETARRLGAPTPAEAPAQ
jgi:cytoskeletal protein RodZ